jgi:MoxR-like ATPase
LHGRYHLSTDDVIAVAKPVMRHRIVTNFNADAEGQTADKLIDRLVEIIPAKGGRVVEDPQAKKMVRA